MNEQEVLKILRDVGAVITDSHIVYTSGKHGTAYVNKDAVYPHVEVTSLLCRAIAKHFREETLYGIDVVVAPAVGGVILCTWIACWLEKITYRKALALYAEKSENGEAFVFRRGYDKFIPGRRVLVVEDILTTGGSAKKVIEAVRALGGSVIGLGVLCNRGGITPQDVSDPPELFALVNVKLDAWDEADCPLCAQGIPINTDVGKGKEFLQRNSDKFLVCPNPKCKGLAHYIDKEKSVFSCPKCGVTPAGLEFD